MDSRNVNFSIKKSQIDTHMLGLAQKLTKLDIALEGQVFHGILGLVPKKWPWKGFCLPFVYRLLQSYWTARLNLCKNLSKTPEIGGNWLKHENSGNINVYGVTANCF